jgi:hypothetical protein
VATPFIGCEPAPTMSTEAGLTTARVGRTLDRYAPSYQNVTDTLAGERLFASRASHRVS